MSSWEHKKLLKLRAHVKYNKLFSLNLIQKDISWISIGYGLKHERCKKTMERMKK